MRIFFYFTVLLLVFCFNADARVNLIKYDIAAPFDSAVLKKGTDLLNDSAIRRHPMLATRRVISDIQVPHMSRTQTSDFYLLLLLCITLGVIKFLDQRYFLNLWLAFWNPALSNRQLKDQLQSAGLPNFLMNVFFTIAEGSYIYYVVEFYTPHHSGVIPSSLLIVMLICGTALIYFAKYAAVRFSGWAFSMESVTEQYLFNVFLVNKILAIVLIPFIIALAFADRGVVSQLIIVSFVVAGLILANRYFRSWQVFGSFFQYSKFHFFMYLCASEILPLAVLMKLLVKGLLFY